MAKYYDDDNGVLELEVTYPADYDPTVTLTTGSVDRVQGTVEPNSAASDLYKKWGTIWEKQYHKDTVVKLVRNRRYTNRKNSRTKHYEREIVKQWRIDEFLTFVKSNH